MGKPPGDRMVGQPAAVLAMQENREPIKKLKEPRLGLSLPRGGARLLQSEVSRPLQFYSFGSLTFVSLINFLTSGKKRCHSKELV